MKKHTVCSAQRAESSEYKHCLTKIAASIKKSRALTDLNSAENGVRKVCP